MKTLRNIKQTVTILAMTVFLLTACNKLELAPVPLAAEDNGTTPTLATLLDAPEFSLLKAAVSKAGLTAVLTNTSLRYTVFAPDNAAIRASLGVPDDATAAAFIASRPDAEINALVSYHVIPQKIASTSISAAFPNFEYPSILNPAPTLNELLRLTTFPSKRSNGAWVNNIPITAVDINAVNGVVHKVARLVAPPSTDLWARIQTDPELTYLKAAIERADTGVPPGSRLQDALNTAVNPLAIASNLTIFAPTDAAMSAFVTGAITQALIAQSVPPATAQAQAVLLVTTYGTTLISNPASIPVYGAQLDAVLTPTLAQGIVIYHILSAQSGSFAPPGIRVFSVNLPTAATTVKTLLNAGVPAHPGVTVQAAFVPGQPVVATATVKGAANATAANVLVGLATSDQHHVNGVIHKIDQVLLPQ
ncbi:MAG TPA: fasciclin domain-containing protein [Ferruginibacter sp.]|mgnify:CR=1 FL=1|nr:fasciclin domain-containing protein [Ferruginibacter sp.]HMP20141.1 fasciclin domain-containing protein [Ferruginibacter sp.]